MKKNFAFTLAEVLITLTIIGVIAALTIPNLIQSWKKHQVEVGLKEAYSILNNALKMTIADGKADDIADMIETMNKSVTVVHRDGYNFFAENYLLPYLKVTKTCDAYQSRQSCPILDSTKKMDGTALPNASEYNPNERYRIQLSNGMQIGVGQDFNDSIENLSFEVDINGSNKPNRLGYDTFYFVISSARTCTASTNPNSRYCNKPNVIRGGGMGTSDYTFFNNNCFGAGALCAAPIQRNGWKIPDDYPVKKF